MISKTKTRELAVYKQQKVCDEESVFVVEGVKMCEEVLAANLPVKTICATNLWLSEHPNLPSDSEVLEVDDNALDKLSNLRTPNEVWMLLPRPVVQTAGGHPSLTLALDHLQDPGNMGTIIRTADWFGIRRIVCSEGTVSCYNPKVVQSTMGSLVRTEIIDTDLPSFLSECGMPVYGALLDGEDIWGDSHPLHLQPGGSVLVIGNESRGITPEVQQFVTHRVMIPNIGGTAESLNASVACAILIAELMR